MVAYRVGVSRMVRAYYDAAQVTLSSKATPNVMGITRVMRG
jgi:hypothetical protein